MTLQGRLYIAGVMSIFYGFLTFGEPNSPLKIMGFGLACLGYAHMFPNREPKKKKAQLPGPSSIKPISSTCERGV